MQRSTNQELSIEEQQSLIESLVAQEELELLEPEQIKIESSQGLETVWTWGATLTILFGLGLLSRACTESSSSNPMMTTGIYLMFGAAAIFIALRLLTDNYYILDLEARQLLYHQKFLGFRQLVPQCYFSALAAVVVNGTKERSRSGSYWDYEVILLTKENRRYRISDGSQYRLDQYNQMATDLGSLLGCESYPCGEEEQTEIIYHPEEQQIAVRQLQQLPFSLERLLKKLGGILVAMLCLAAFIALMFALSLGR